MASRKWLTGSWLFTLLLGFMPLSHGDIKDLPHPYCDLKEVLPFDGHGWYINAEPLRRLIRDHHVVVVVEVGSWLGCSTRDIASHLPIGGMVYAVDHWLGSVEHQPGNDAWHPSLPMLYEQFLSNVIHAGLTDRITPVRLPSLEAARSLAVQPDLVYIDAGHDYESVYADLTAWYPFVQGHGVLCGDDWLWSSVREAVVRFADENSLQVESEGNFWCYRDGVGSPQKPVKVFTGSGLFNRNWLIQNSM